MGGHPISAPKTASSDIRLSTSQAYQLAAIIESNDDAIYSTDLDAITMTWNTGAERLYGYSADEIIGRSASVLLPRGREEELFRCIACIKQGEHLERYDTVRLRKDGSEVDVAIMVSPILDEGGAVVAVSAIARDISHRIASERALRSSLAELHHVNAELFRKTRSLRTLTACTQALVRATEEMQLLQAVCSVAVFEGGYLMARVGYCENDAERSVLPVASEGGDGSYHNRLNVSWGEGSTAQGPVGRSIRENRTAVSGDIETDPGVAAWRDAAREQGFRSIISLPLRDEDGTPFGALTIYSGDGDAFDGEEVRLLEQLAADLSYGVMSLRSRAERDVAERLVHDLAYIDALTGLPNRRLLEDRAAMALAHARRCEGSVAAVFVDLDRLKAINDEFGHAAGDEVIRQTGVRLTGVLRDGDTVARIGGDEFVVVLLECDEGGADFIAERILETVAEPMFVEGHEVQISASVGVANDRGGTLDTAALFRLADEAMYAVKRSGGNGRRRFTVDGTSSQ